MRKNNHVMKTKTVLFVEKTDKGELASRLRKLETRLSDVTGYRIKIVEKGGTSLKQSLPNTNPWAGEHCGREKCRLCGQGDETKQDCMRRCIVYESRCLGCEGDKDLIDEEKGRLDKGALLTRNGGIYVGETSRSLMERMGEHWEDFKSEKDDSHIFKHWELVHGREGYPDIRFKMIRSYQDALSRQVGESVRIGMRGKVMNSKTVYSRCSLPRLVVDKGWEERRKETDDKVKRMDEKVMETAIDWGGKGLNRKRNPFDRGEEKLSRRKRQKRMADSNWGEEGGEEDKVRDDWLHGGADKATWGSMRQSTLTVVRFSDKEWVEKCEQERLTRDVACDKENSPTDQNSVWEEGDRDEWMGELLDMVENGQGREEMTQKVRRTRQTKLNELWCGDKDSVNDKECQEKVQECSDDKGGIDCGVTKKGNTTSEKTSNEKSRNIKRRLLARIVCSRIVSDIVTRAACSSTNTTALSRLSNCLTSKELTKKVIDTAKGPNGRGLKRKRKSKNKLGEVLVVNCDEENYPLDIRFKTGCGLSSSAGGDIPGTGLGNEKKKLICKSQKGLLQWLERGKFESGVEGATNKNKSFSHVMSGSTKKPRKRRSAHVQNSQSHSKTKQVKMWDFVKRDLIGGGL